jgi:hypothetical protein
MNPCATLTQATVPHYQISQLLLPKLDTGPKVFSTFSRSRRDEAPETATG